MASFNPIYGQGMTIAAMQAEALRACLLTPGGSTTLATRYFRKTAKAVDLAWRLACAADLLIPSVPGRRRIQLRALNAYVDRLQTAAEHQIDIGAAFWQVAGFLEPPSHLFTPRMLRAAYGKTPTQTTKGDRPHAG